jgi:hypothetical protein
LTNPYKNLTPRQAAVRRYFTPTPRFPNIIGTAAAALAGLILIVAGLGSGAFLTVVGFAVLAIDAWKVSPRLLRYRRLYALAEPKPSDHQMDLWLAEALDPAREAGFRRLHLQPSDLLKDEPPLLVVGFPEDGEFPQPFAIGKDGELRSAYYHLLVIYLTDWHLSTYRCLLQMETGDLMADQTHEFTYRDIVSVATTSDRVTWKVPLDHSKRAEDPADAKGNADPGGPKAKEKEEMREFTTEQWFRLRVSNDETKLRVCVVNYAVHGQGGDDSQESMVDTALRQIRGRLRDYTQLREQASDSLRDVRTQARRPGWDS